jgi:hypothetical protein
VPDGRKHCSVNEPGFTAVVGLSELQPFAVSNSHCSRKKIGRSLTLTGLVRGKEDTLAGPDEETN